MSKNSKIIIIIGILILLVIIFFVFNRKEEGQESIQELTAPAEDRISELEGDTEKLFKLANEYYKKDDFENAGKVYLELLKIKPNENLYRLNLGDIYTSSGDLEKAEKIYLEALSLNKKEMNAYVRLSDIYTDLKKKDIPEEVINNLIEITVQDGYTSQTENVIAIQQLARMYKIMEDYENSIKYYQMLVDLEVPTKEEIQKMIEDLKIKQEEAKNKNE